MKKVLLLLLICLSFTSCLSTKKVTGSIYKTHDKFQQCDFYRNKNIFSKNKCFDVYIVDSTTVYPRITVFYSGDNWIFFEKAIILNKEGETINFVIPSYEKETDVVSAKKVTEFADIVITKEEAIKLKSVLEGGFVRMRLQGKKTKTYILKTQGLIKLLNYYLEEM